MNFDQFKLIRIVNDTVYYFDTLQELELQAYLYTLPETRMIWQFSMEDKEIITNAAIDDGFYTQSQDKGVYKLKAHKRQHYIFFFFAIFSFSILMSLFTCIRYVHIGDATLYGSFLFFPLTFACTDIINEIYGYARVRSIIYTSAIALILMAALMAMTMGFNGTLTNGADDAPYHDLLGDIPVLMVINALVLLMTDSLNAYLFHRIKERLRGDALWLRSLVSTFIGNFFHSVLVMYFIAALGIVDLSRDKMLDILCSGHLIKMLYALACLPLIYFCVYIVHQHESRHPVKDILS